jgi:hypothetical protein
MSSFSIQKVYGGEKCTYRGVRGIMTSVFELLALLTVKHSQNISYMDAENYWILLRRDAPNLTAFSLATLERFTTAPVQIFGSKQDPFISALA